MDGIITSPSCNPTQGGTAIDGCWAYDSKPKGIILTFPDVLQFSNSGGNSFVSLFRPRGISNSDITFPASPSGWLLNEGLVNVDVQGGEPETTEEGFGDTIVSGHSPYVETYTFVQGGYCFYKAVSSFHGRRMRVMWVDDQDIVYGTPERNNIKGFLVNVGVHWRPNSGTSPSATIITLYYAREFSKTRATVGSVQMTLPTSSSEGYHRYRTVSLHYKYVTSTEGRVFPMVGCTRMNATTVPNMGSLILKLSTALSGLKVLGGSNVTITGAVAVSDADFGGGVKLTFSSAIPQNARVKFDPTNWTSSAYYDLVLYLHERGFILGSDGITTT